MVLQLIWLNSFWNKPGVLSFCKSPTHYRKYFLVSTRSNLYKYRRCTHNDRLNRGQYSRETHELNSLTSSATYQPCPSTPSPSCPTPSSLSKNQSWPSGKQGLNYYTSFNPTLQRAAPQGWIQQGCVLFRTASISFCFQAAWIAIALVLRRTEL